MSEEQLKAEGADVLAIAKAAGFSITTEDLKAHRQTLSDDELEGVAGGGGGCWLWLSDVVCTVNGNTTDYCNEFPLHKV